MLSPVLAQMPLPVQSYDEPFLPFGKTIVDATRDLVAGYVFDLAAYLALGAAGAIALERTIAYARVGGSLTILQGAFASAGYARAAVAFSVDAVTLASADAEVEAAYAAVGIAVYRFQVGSDDNLVQSDGSRKLSIVGSNVIYAHRGEDFAVRIRAALQAGWQS